MTITVYFDLDGTLCTYDTSFEEQFETTVSPHGEPTEAAYDAYVGRLFDALDRCQSEPYRRAFEAAAAETPLGATPAALARAHRETELDASVVSADAKRVLERVAATNPTGVLTNGDGEQQRAKLERHGVGRFVDDVIVSNDAGVRKPDRRIFDLARDRLPGDEYVYVGDSYEADIVGARAAGFRTVYVDATRDDETDVDAADAVVSDVAALLDPTLLPPSVAEPFEAQR